ncbi:MAG: hypothetical protein MJE68_32180, partial [Proteobacteria bacterium]|nr:hypothetical protein [Pseudomonadota bacterium]
SLTIQQMHASNATRFTVETSRLTLKGSHTAPFSPTERNTNSPKPVAAAPLSRIGISWTASNPIHRFHSPPRTSTKPLKRCNSLTQS